MSLDLRLLSYSAILTWVMIMFASLVRTHGWTPAGLQRAFGNRDALPEATAMAARADRAAKNMLENLILFIAIVVAAHGAADQDRVALGARMFFWARVAYWPVYVLGIRYVRTALWSIGVAGCAVMLSAAL
jgi:uncharacterized MAPEG superfamily protein